MHGVLVEKTIPRVVYRSVAFLLPKKLSRGKVCFEMDLKILAAEIDGCKSKYDALKKERCPNDVPKGAGFIIIA